MIQNIDYPIVGPVYNERSPEMDLQTTINWYEIIDPSGVKPKGFSPTPGTKLATNHPLNSSQNPIRQIFQYKNLGLVFSGASVYTFDEDLDINFVANINSVSGYISVCNSTEQVLIIDGKDGYVYDMQAGTLTKITDPYFPENPLMGVYFDSFFAVCTVDSNEWEVSAANDATNWTLSSAPNSALITVKADTFKGMAVVNQRLFLFGNYITEVWYPGINPNFVQFPYSRDNNSLFEFGCAATASIANGARKDDGIMFWLSSTKQGIGSVMMTDGGKPITISTPAVDIQLQSYSVVEDAIGFSYNMDGYIFYQLTFPSQNVSWLCNMSVKDEQGYPSWSYLQLINGDCNMATCHVYSFKQKKHFVGSNQGPRILEFSSSIQTNDGVDKETGFTVNENIVRERIGRNLTLPDYDRFVIIKFELDFEGGVGNANEPGENPKVYFSNSYDGGHTFSQEREEEIGRIGQYKYRANIFGIGITRSFVPRIRVFGNVRMYLMGSNLTINKCIN